MLVVFAIMHLLLSACIKLPQPGVLYITARAVTTAEFIAALHWQLYVFFRPEPFADSSGLKVSVLLMTFAVLAIVGYFAERRHLFADGSWESDWGAAVIALGVATVTFAMSNISFVTLTTPFSGRSGLEVFYIRTLVDLLGWVALYAQQEKHRELQLRTENATMTGLLRSQHEQYLLAQRNNDEMNRKYHDMKHHLAVFRAESDPAQKNEYLDSLEQAIKGYGDQTRTGNAVLDTILAAKRLLAAEHGIELNCVADGSLLDTVAPIDIVAIVSNALDNAIEGTRRVADPELRAIRVAVFAHGDFVMLRVENPFDGVLHKTNGRIVTRKRNSTGHGFGLRSIEAAAESYGGTMTVAFNDNWFSLRVLLPVANVVV
jgi:predicted metal-dependent phosphoesterase TrpH